MYTYLNKYYSLQLNVAGIGNIRTHAVYIDMYILSCLCIFTGKAMM